MEKENEIEERLKYFIEHIGDGVWCFELPSPLDLNLPLEEKVKQSFQAICIECNDAYALMYGLSREEMIGRKLDDIKPFDDPINQTYLRTFFENDCKIDNVISHEFDPQGNEKWILNGMFGEIVDGKIIRAWGRQSDITERKLAEEKLLRLNEELEDRVKEQTASLRKSEERHRSTLDNMLEGCQIIDFEFRYIYVNDVAAKQGHRTKEELLGHTMMGMYPGIEMSQMFDKLRQCMVERLPHNMENEFIYSDGSKAWFDLRMEPVPEGTFILSIDITESKLAEQALRKKDEHHRLVIENIFRFVPEGLLIFSRTLGLMRQNKAFEEIVKKYALPLGYAEQELTEKIIEQVRRKIESEDSKEIHIWEKDRSRTGLPEGDQRDKLVLEFNAARIFLAEEARIVVSLSDVTERKLAEEASKRAEEALLLEKENFHRYLDGSPLGVCIVTADGDTLYANRAILEMYSYDSPEELRKTPVWKRYTPESYVEFQKRKKQRQRGDFCPFEYEISIVKKNGEVRHLHVFRKEVLWNGEKQFQTLYRDITEVKKREDILKEFETTLREQNLALERKSSSLIEMTDRLAHYKAEFETSYAKLKADKDAFVRSEKLAFTGRIATSIAHEIRNPLTNVFLSVRQLKKGNKVKQEGLKHIEIVERNVERINFLITELLNCARPEKLNLQPYDVHQIINDALDFEKTKIRLQRIKVTKNFTPLEVPAKGGAVASGDLLLTGQASKSSILKIDKEHMGRALLNLITNAIDAMPRGGNLTIITESSKDFFLIKINDTGKGIPEKDIIKIFDPFFSTKPQGIGLGLTTCYGIIVSHGGTIDVESKWRKGTTFSVYLPR
ncbi:MAG: PAS domain S-box protein [Bacteroidetes bacterium]|nr:PAS domain S-box protein [Bacteroidota bacterium]